MVVKEKPLERLVLGVPVTCFRSATDAAAYVVQTVKKRKKTYCVAINPEKICFTHRDAVLRDIVRKATFHVCDGAGTAIAVRILWGIKIPRVTGIGLFLRMLALAEKEDLSVYLLGARPETADQAYEMLRRKHPKLRCAGHRDGYFDEDESASIVREINASRADMLFVAMGSPKQECWIAKHRAQLEVPFCMGVGGSFDVLSGRVKRAPGIFRRTGTEWLYRLSKEPSRWRRQTVLWRFAAGVLKQRFWSYQPDAYPQMGPTRTKEISVLTNER